MHGFAPLRHRNPPEGRSRADRCRPRAALCLRPDGLRLRPYRQCPAGHRVRRACSGCCAFVYGADHVTYARNITDVDDKINARAAERRHLRSGELTDGHAGAVPSRRRCARLPAADRRAARHRPHRGDEGDHRAPDRARRRLCRRGARAVLGRGDGPAARRAALRRAGPPLARRDDGRRPRRCRALQARPDGFRACGSRRGAGQPGWPSPAGIATPGRPGWHIECSAMSMDELLVPFGGGLSCDDPARNVFDIHGGGIDLVFPHHENELAQSCCAFGVPRMANIWMHNGFLQVEGQKMSKSLGNFVTIHELLRHQDLRRPRLARRRAAAGDAAHPLPPADRLDGEGAGGGRADPDRWYDEVGDVSVGDAAPVACSARGHGG